MFISQEFGSAKGFDPPGVDDADCKSLLMKEVGDAMAVAASGFEAGVEGGQFKGADLLAKFFIARERVIDDEGMFAARSKEAAIQLVFGNINAKNRSCHNELVVSCDERFGNFEPRATLAVYAACR